MMKAATAAIFCLLVSIPAVQAQDPFFDGVMERLDLNGSFFTYFGSEHIVRDLEKMVGEGLPAMLKLNHEFEEAEPFLQLGSKAYKTSGLSALGGLGMSQVTLPNGVGRAKTVIRQGDGDGVLWKVFGTDILPQVKALPADTEAVFGLGLRLDHVLDWVEGTIEGSPMEGMYQQTMEAVEEQIDVKSALKELQDLIISVQLDSTKTMEYPVGDSGETMTIPLVRAVARASISGDTIPKTITTLLEELGMETTEQKMAGGTAQVLPEIMPNVQPCWLIKDGTILFASDPVALKGALKSARNSNKTLGEQAAFQKHLGSIKFAHTAFYTSPELSRNFSKIQAESLKKMEAEGELPPEMESLTKLILGGGEPSGTFSATYQDGKFIETINHTTGPKKLKMGVASTAILAAILVPAVTKVIGDAKMTEMKSNGKNMYVVAFADAIDANEIGFPSSKDGYKGTHEFFRAQHKKRLLLATPDFVAGPGVPAAASWDKLTAANCAWRVVLDNDEATDAGTPYLISANLKIDTLGDDWLASLDRKGPMKGNVVIAYHGGGAEVIRPVELALRQAELLKFVDKKTKVLKP